MRFDVTAKTIDMQAPRFLFSYVLLCDQNFQSARMLTRRNRLECPSILGLCCETPITFMLPNSSSRNVG